MRKTLESFAAGEDAARAAYSEYYKLCLAHGQTVPERPIPQKRRGCCSGAVDSGEREKLRQFTTYQRNQARRLQIEEVFEEWVSILIACIKIDSRKDPFIANIADLFNKGFRKHGKLNDADLRNNLIYFVLRGCVVCPMTDLAKQIGSDQKDEKSEDPVVKRIGTSKETAFLHKVLGPLLNNETMEEATKKREQSIP